LGPEIGQVTYRFYQPKRDRSVVKTVVYFLVTTAVRPVRPEHLFDRAEWVTFDGARERLEFDADRAVLDLVEKHLAHPA
jgi:hypothetical protein